jgi:hypothetical protein
MGGHAYSQYNAIGNLIEDYGVVTTGFYFYLKVKRRR